jgi:signal transduction histidine kinase
MSLIAAAAAAPPGAADQRSHLLPLCTGAFAISFSLVAALLAFDAVATAAAVAVLTVALLAALWSRQRIRETRAQLERAVQEGEALNRANSELRRFAFAVAHDLRAPLVSTKGMLNIAKEVASAGELGDVIRLLDRASHTAQRMDGVITGILDLAIGDSEGASHPRSDLVDLNLVLANSLEDMGPALEERGFDVRRDEDLGLVRGDARHVQQVFDNLVGNAVKYVRPTVPGQAPVLAIRATRLRRSVRIAISDNGPGIPHARRAGLLQGTQESPSAASSALQGSPKPVSGANLGLGLPLTKMAVEECGGTLAIQTSPMGGTEFVLDFVADPCVIPDSIPSTLPEAVPSAVLADHSCFSSRTMLTTG